MSQLEYDDSSPAFFDPYRRYRSSLLARNRVRELSKLRPWRAVIDTLCFWSWIILAWLAVARWPQWWTVAIAVPVIATRYYALLIVGHDGIHRRLFRSPRWNDWFADCLIFGPVAGITRINNQNHLGHHRHLSTPHDPDLHQFTCTNKYEWHLLLAYLSGVSSLWRSFRNVFGGASRAASGGGGMLKVRHTHTMRDLGIIAAWQIGLMVGLTWLVAWWAYPLLWLAPLYLAFLADNLRAFAEHSRPEPDELADRHRLISYLSSPVERLFLAPCNMNFHAAHHLWPSIPYYNLPQADGELRALSAGNDLEWRSSYLGYLWHYWTSLPLRDCDRRQLASSS